MLSHHIYNLYVCQDTQLVQLVLFLRRFWLPTPPGHESLCDKSYERSWLYCHLHCSFSIKDLRVRDLQCLRNLLHHVLSAWCYLFQSDWGHWKLMQIQLLQDSENADILLMSARALTFLADVMPACCGIIVRHQAVPVLCARLLNIEYIDVAEQSLTVSIQARVVPAWYNIFTCLEVSLYAISQSTPWLPLSRVHVSSQEAFCSTMATRLAHSPPAICALRVIYPNFIGPL